MPDRPRKLLDQVRDAVRVKHYSIRTEQTYVAWTRRFVVYHNMRHPLEMGESEVEAFLTHLAVDRHVSASTQNQAFNALLFLYRNVLGKQLGEEIDSVRATRPNRLPVVMTEEEVRRVISCMHGVPQIMAKLLYGGGLRAMEVLRLRVKDIAFEQNYLLVRDGKGAKDRTTTLAESLQRV